MRNLVLGSIDDGKFNVEKLKNGCRAISKRPKYDENDSSRKTKILDFNTGSDNLDKKLKLYNELSPIDFLALKNDNIPPLAVDCYLIENLKEKTSLPDPVINVLLDYILLIQDGKLPRALVEKYAGSLQRKKIVDSYEAMLYLNKSSSSTCKTINTVPPNVENKENPEPESMEDLMAELRQYREEAKRNG